MNDFFGGMFNLFGELPVYENLVEEVGAILTSGLCVFLIPIILLTVYYIAIDSDRFSSGWFWVLLVFVIGVVNFIISSVVTYRELYEQYEPDYIVEVLPFSLVVFLWTWIISFLWTMIVKWGSRNCRRTPF